jgi:phosphotransferase system  glucose/maltose/N-acetylglucosamine-specific IIC component
MNDKKQIPPAPLFQRGNIQCSDFCTADSNFCTTRFAQIQSPIQSQTQTQTQNQNQNQSQTQTQTQAHGASGFAPFEKGGYGGFALALRNNRRDSDTNADALRRDP